MNGDARIGVFVQSWISDFCVKNLKILVSVRCGRECQLNQCSLNEESCVECVEVHECSLLTGTFFAELAN